MNHLTKSLVAMQKERLLIAYKELYHIENVLKFFLGDNSNPNFPIKRNIKNILKDINNIKAEIVGEDGKSGLNGKVLKDLENNKNRVLFLVTFNYVKIKIEDILKIIDTIYNKMRQMFNESLNQYLPYPSLGRRYSNNSLVVYLEFIFRDMLSRLDTNEKSNKELILDWDYKTDFNYRKFYSPDINLEQVGDYNYYIDLPYSYYELPYLLPSISYQIVQIILKNNEHNNKNYLIDFKNNIKETIKKQIIEKSSLVHQVYDLLGHDKYLDTLITDIISDAVSYSLHKESYIYTLTHQSLGEGLAKDFFKEEENNQFSISPNSWNFSLKKDHVILRLWLLVKLYKDENRELFEKKDIYKQNIKKYKNNKETNTYYDKNYIKKITKSVHNINAINELEQYLKTLIDLEDSNKETKADKETFEYIYTKNYPNFYDSFDATKLYLKILYRHFINENYYGDIKKYINTKIIQKYNGEINQKKHFYHYNKYYNHCWEKRFNELTKSTTQLVTRHPNCFRTQLHSDLKEYSRRKIKDMFYTMRLYKIRKNKINPTEKGFDELEKNELLKNFEYSEDPNIKTSEHLNLLSYGIYDFINLKKAKGESTIVEKHIDVYKKAFNTILDENGIKFFETKYILLRVDKNGINKEINELLSDINQEGAIFQIELEKNINNPNGYENLLESIEEIDTLLKEKKFMIFKSLGPKDLVVVIFNINIKEIHKLSNDLLNQSMIRRTFTTIFYHPKNNTKEIVSKTKELYICSYIRLKNNQNITKKDSEKINHIYSITGVIDKKIVWESETKISEIHEFYNENIEKLADYYTKFELEE